MPRRLTRSCSNMCATGPPIPKNLGNDLIGQDVFPADMRHSDWIRKQFGAIPSTKNSPLRQYFFPEKIPRASFLIEKSLRVVTDYQPLAQNKKRGKARLATHNGKAF